MTIRCQAVWAANSSTEPIERAFLLWTTIQTSEGLTRVLLAAMLLRAAQWLCLWLARRTWLGSSARRRPAHARCSARMRLAEPCRRPGRGLAARWGGGLSARAAPRRRDHHQHASQGMLGPRMHRCGSAARSGRTLAVQRRHRGRGVPRRRRRPSSGSLRLLITDAPCDAAAPPLSF